MSTEKFGNYQVIRRIAVGGMGEIFLARQASLTFERLAVVKTVLEEASEDGDRREMFLTEARVVALLNHPNIVQVYELGEQNGTLYLAMEYVEGETLGRIALEARRQGAMQLWPFVDACIQAARALHHAHQLKDAQGEPLHLVHRDISPQNLMVRLDGAVKVLDFGIAKIANASLRTRTGMFKGKPAYMAPEQVHRRDMDARADVFSLGVVLWEMTTGRRMFPDMSDYDILTDVVDKPRPRPSGVVENFPPDLEAVIMKALALDASERWQSAAEMADALEAVLRKVPDEARPKLGPYVETLVGAQVRARHHGDATPVPEAAIVTQATTTPERARPPTPSSHSAPREDLPLTVPGRHTPLEARAPTRNMREPRALSSVGTIAFIGLAFGALGTMFIVSREPSSVMDAEMPEVREPSSPSKWSSVVVDVPPPVEEPAAASSSSEPARAEAPRPRPVAPAAPSSSSAAPGAVVFHPPPPLAAPVKALGYVTISSEPWARAFVDGKELGPTPLYKRELPAGEHELVLENEGLKLRKVTKFTVQAGKLVKLRETLQ